jgi:hypothetical protein
MELTSTEFEPPTAISALADSKPPDDTRTMTHDRSNTVNQFLHTRRALAKTGNLDEVEKLDETLRDIAATDPDQAITILQELSRSDDFTAKEAAAIFLQYVFPSRQEQVATILVTLLSDPNPDIARQALTTIDQLTGDPQLNTNQAAHRITELANKSG